MAESVCRVRGNLLHMGIYTKAGIALVAALILSFAATPAVKLFAQFVGAIDVPKDARRIHKQPLPRLGGLAIFIGFILSVVLLADINRQVQGILLGAVIIVTLGVIDDIIQLPALAKFFVQIIAALVAIYHGVVIEVLSNPIVFSESEYLSFGLFSIPVTVLWIVAITNSVNLIDGLDGLAVGVSTISSIVMLVIAMMVSEENVAVIIAALAGACLGFLPYNFNPAKIFMGDTGALLLGYVLATISILGLFKSYAVVSFAAPFLVLGLPLFDTSFAFLRRLLSGKNPMSPDRGHLHHRLIDMGMSQKRAVAILYTVSGLLGLGAVFMTTSAEIRVVVLAATILVAAGFVIFLYRHRQNGAHDCGTNNDEEPEDSEPEAAYEDAEPGETESAAPDKERDTAE